MRMLPLLLLLLAFARAEPAPLPLAPPVDGPATLPSLAAGRDGTVYLTWCGPAEAAGGRTLWLARLEPGASAWGRPLAVASSREMLENWADFPSLAVATDGALWAQWYQRDPAAADGYSGWHARSTDQGRTWSKPAPLGQMFVSLAPMSGGRMLAVWLQAVGQPGPRPAHGAASGAPPMRLQARLLAPGGETVQDWVVDPDTCTCCQTSLAVLPNDRVLVAYRGHTADEIRDNRFSILGGVTWSPPRPVHRDGWKIPACPVNGPAAAAQDEHVALAWFTGAQGARVQAEYTRDAGLTLTAPAVVDLGRPIGRIDLVMLPDGSSLVSWLEAGGTGTEAGLYVRRFFPDGALSAPLRVATLSAARASGFPRLAPRRGPDLPVVIAWTEAGGDESRIRTAVIPAATLVRAGAAPAAAGNSRGFGQVELCSPDAMRTAAP